MTIPIHLAVVVILLSILFFVIRHERQIALSKIKKSKLVEVWDGSERRQSSRVESSLPISCVSVSDKRAPSTGCTRNISTGGLQFISESFYHVNDLVKIDIYLPGQQKFNATCEVVWVDEINMENADRRYFSVGMKFDKITSRDKSLLSNFIASITDLKGHSEKK